MIRRLPLLASVAAATASPSLTQPPAAGGGEIQSTIYLQNRVVPLTVSMGYALLVELSPDERIDNVVVGDSSAWQVTTTRQGNQIVVKPISAVTTDLIVTTTSRRYVFLLQPAEGESGGPFVLRFDYPEPFPASTFFSSTVIHYRLHGDAALFPDQMSGTSERTSIVWKSGGELPAVYALDGKGHEALINGRMVGQTYVIEGSAARYIFRRDKAKAIAVREKDMDGQR